MTPEREPHIRRWTATFADPAWERAFRVDTFPQTRRFNRGVAVIVTLLVLGHAATDYAATGGGEAFWAFLSVRLATAALILMMFPLTASPRRLALADWGVFVAQISVAASFIYISASLSPEVIRGRIGADSMTAIMLVLGLYFFIRTRLVLHVVAGLATSTAYIGTSILVDRLPPDPAAIEAAMHLTCNLLAFFTLNAFHRLQRRRFAAMRAVQTANERLEAQQHALKRTAEQLRRARDEAIYANRAKSEFLAHMSHELRSPMNAIIGFSEVMKEQVFGEISPPRYREYADDIHASGTHLLSVINDILDLSKAEAGKIDMQERTVRLPEIMDSVVRLVSERARRAGLRVAFDLPDNLPALWGDPRLIKQMVLNLLTNAIKFTPENGRITVSAGRTAEGGLRIAVSDTGIGIEAEDIPRILEPYGQVAKAEQPGSEAGTGLGLPLVKTMVELHDGRMEVDSTPGEGSVFALTFPPARTVEPEAERSDGPGNGGDPASSEGGHAPHAAPGPLQAAAAE